jgi:NAD(P)-dependent dehydrogenase (short-subunit alcohol dehydrogenase family)
VDLEGRVALITGGTRGIGRAIAERFVEAGARVMIVARRQEELQETVHALGDRSASFIGNAGDPEAPAAAVDLTVQRFGRLDVLVNNAATNPYWGSLMGIDAGQMDKTVQVNQRAIVLWSQAAWKQAMSRNGGNIINIASVGGMGPEQNIGYYNATKAAVIHLTRQLAAELAPTVRVNAIAPGLIATRLSRALVERYGERAGARIPLGRIGRPEDIAGAALFLASDSASWITGITLVVDGGALYAGGLGAAPPEDLRAETA